MVNVLSHVSLDVVLHEDFSAVRYWRQRDRALDVGREGREHRVTSHSTTSRAGGCWPRILANTFLTRPIIGRQREMLLVAIGTNVPDSKRKDRWRSVVEAALTIVVATENVVQVDDALDVHDRANALSSNISK